MGIRYRKSINIGKGFRINVSKSGIGYSWGTKGYRVTKTSTGRTRKTYSLPGTGLSYVKERSSNKPQVVQKSPSKSNTLSQKSLYDTQHFTNADAESLHSEELSKMIKDANDAVAFRNISVLFLCISLLLCLLSPWFMIISIALIGLIIFIYCKKTININCTAIEQANLIEQRMAPLLNIAKSQKLWRIDKSGKTINPKYSAGAAYRIRRSVCTANTQLPFPFKTDSTAVVFRFAKETLAFLPDRLIIFQEAKIGAVSYDNFRTTAHATRYIEHDDVPSDAHIVDYTWQYPNKDGGPDKRFRDNRRLPVCLYGEFTIEGAGLNTIIMFSNLHIG